jgi:hypothetical protein
MDGATWIRSQLTSFSCASCGSDYLATGVRILAQREELFFVALDCADCTTEAVAIVSLEVARPTAGGGPGAGEPEAGGVPNPSRESAVDAADVLVMHEFLRDFDGDFRRLFRRAPRDHPGPAPA